MSHNIHNVQFSVKPLYNKVQPNSLRFLMQRYSFWVATLSIFSFVVGNLVGQHGWYAVYKSVLGEGLDAQIVYTGTVSPVEFVPDYEKWALYGGDSRDHTFRQVPKSVLVPLPTYSPTLLNTVSSSSSIENYYSVGYAGSYATGHDGDGFHPGIDIPLPEGTPVRAIANGIVERAEYISGFGNTIVLRHPNVPDPSNPAKVTTLYSGYAHLSSIHVKVDDLVGITGIIGLSGSTGNSTGPHLHFQIDKADAPYHPFWPNDNNRDSVYQYTISPLLYVQSNYKPAIIVKNTSRTTIATSVQTTSRTVNVSATADRRALARQTNASRLLSLREDRLRDRLVQNESDTKVTTVTRNTTELQKPTVLSESVTIVASKPVATVQISHDGMFELNQDESIFITLLDENGAIVQHPNLDRGLYLKTAYGSAQFDIPILEAEDFNEGRATVTMRSDSSRTVVIQIQPYGTLSKPITAKRH